MNPELLSKYLDVLDRLIKVGSAAVPIFALILRRMRLINPAKKEAANPVVTATGVVGFGCLGSIFGLLTTIVAGVGGAIYIGMKFMEVQTGSDLGLGSIDWGILGGLLSKTNLIAVGASIVCTLLTFGGKEQPKGLAFIAGVSA